MTEPTRPDINAPPRKVINPETYDVTILSPGIMWTGVFTRDYDPELARVIDNVVTFIRNRG